MKNSFPTRGAMGFALVMALGGTALATEAPLDNFDINVVQAQAKSDKLPSSATGKDGVSRDVLGREAFSWLHRDLPAHAKRATLSAEDAARLHLGALQSAKSGSASVDHLRLKTVDKLPGGARIVQFEPRIDGVEVFREGVALILDRENTLIAMRGPLSQAGDLNKSSHPAFKLDAVQATRTALRELGVFGARDLPVSRLKSSGDYAQLTLETSQATTKGSRPADWARAKPVYYRTTNGLLPAWYVETSVADGDESPQLGFSQVISAVDGALLFRVGLTSHDAPFSYRVWAEGAPKFLPHPSPQGRNGVIDPDGLPTHNEGPLVAQALHTLVNTPFSRSSTDPWLPDDATTTAGNHVKTFADLALPDGLSPGDLEPQLSSNFSFDYPYDPDATPNDPGQQVVSAVQAFFIANWMHDWFYDFGFTEADGNAQVQNFGRGGKEGDRLIIHTRDQAVGFSAFISIFGDGQSPVMQLGHDPDRGSLRNRDMSGQTIMHEWTHYMNFRLIGDATGLDTPHALGMGEGWAFLVPLLVTLKEEDALLAGNAQYAGAYPYNGFLGDSYYGLLRYPFSSDLSKNPLTLRHLQLGFPLPAGTPPSFGADGSSNTSVHQQGEVWATALWEVYLALLNDRPRLQFAEAQRRMKHYLVAGMKLTPVSPTMIEARDALMAVALAEGEPRDFELMAAAFAKRGMGAGASIPDRYSSTLTDIRVSMSVDAHLSVSDIALSVPMGCDADAVLDTNEAATVSVRVTNGGFVPLQNVSLQIQVDEGGFQFPAGNVAGVASLAPLDSVELQVPVTLVSTPATAKPVLIRATPSADGVEASQVVSLEQSVVVNHDVATSAATLQSFTSSLGNWKTRSTPTSSTRASWGIAPSGTSFLALGRDAHTESTIWLESPAIVAASDPLTISLAHRYRFESAGNQVFYDGGIVQVSTDDGITWSNLGAVQAGYPASVLSSCCGNPFAGERALVGSSPGYPSFTQHVVDLGTSIPAGTAVRVRFGVATDGSVAAQGWEIRSVSVSGAANMPFNEVVPQPTTCSVANGKALQGSLSGTYYDPSRSGEGVLLDMGEVGGQPVLFFSWYTYEGNIQKWLVGSALYGTEDRSVAVDVIETRGAQFGALFDRDDVIESAWGSVGLSFPDCQTMDLTYRRRDGESGVLRMARAIDRSSRGQCTQFDASRSGTWYSTARSGEGVLMDFGQVGGTPTQFFSWYTYEAGQQRWLVGAQTFAPNDDSVTLDLVETRGTGFGRGFHREDVEELPWGQVTQRFLDCDTLELTYLKDDGETGVLVMERALEQQGDGVCR